MTTRIGKSARVVTDRSAVRRPLVCYHEAGHAFARWFFGHYTYRAVVLTRDQVLRGDWPVDRKGRVQRDAEGAVDGYDMGPNPFISPKIDEIAFEGEDGDRIRREMRIGAEIDLVDCAIAYTAEARYMKTSASACLLEGGQADALRALATAGWLHSTEAEKWSALALSTRRASALVRSSKGWRAISAIANALIDRGIIDGDDIDTVCCKAYGIDEQHRREAVHDAWPWPMNALKAGVLEGVRPDIGRIAEPRITGIIVILRMLQSARSAPGKP